MGEYTSNNMFYLPAKGATGDTEKGYFDAALESTDGVIVDLQDQIDALVTGSGSSAPILDVTSGYDKDANLVTALATIDTDNVTLACPAGVITISSNTTIPANVNLRMEKGAYFDISTGVTLTINGQIEAGQYKIFQWTGTGKVAFGRGAAKTAYLRWWGTVGDGVTDDTAAVQRAINDAYDGRFNRGYCNLKGSIGDTYLVNPLVCAANGGIFLNLELSDFSLKANPANYGIDISLPYTDVNTTDNTFTFVGHGFVDDDCVIMTCSSGHDSEPGIKDSTIGAGFDYTSWTHKGHNSTFWVKRVSDDIFSIRSLPSQYGNATVCDITSQGTGTHTFSKATTALNLLYSTYRVKGFSITGFKPSGGYVWVTSAVTSEPSALTITGLTPVKRTSFSTLAAAGNWYYNTVSKKLYIVLNSLTNLPKTTYTNITADAQELANTDLEPYFGHGAGISVGRQSLSNIISDGSISYMDKALEYRFVYRTVTERIFTSNCYYSVFGDYDQDMNKANTFKNIHVAVCWGPAAFYWGAGESNLFEFLEVDLYRKKIFHATGATNIALTIRQVYDEGQAGGGADWANNDNISVFTFEDCTAVILENCESYLGALTPTSVTRYFELINSSLKVSGSKIYLMDVTASPAHLQSLYSCDISSSLVFYGGNYANIRSVDGNPSHQQFAVNCSGTLIPASGVIAKSNYAYPETVVSANIFHFANFPVSVTNASGAAAAQDTGTGYGDSNSCKFTFSTENAGSSCLNNVFSTAKTGRWYSVISFFIKADADQSFDIVNCGTAAGKFMIKGDEVWRHYSMVLYVPEGNDASDYHFLWIRRYSGAAGANIWVDCISQRWFATNGEAVSWLTSSNTAITSGV